MFLLNSASIPVFFVYKTAGSESSGIILAVLSQNSYRQFLTMGQNVEIEELFQYL